MASQLPFDVNSFIEKNKAALSPEEIANITELSRGYLRDQDYQRAMNKTKQEQAAWEAQYQSDYDRLKQYEADAATAMTKVNQFETRFGPIDRLLTTNDPNVLRTQTGEFVGRSDVEKMVNDLNTKITSITEDFGNFAKGTYHMIINMPKYADTYREKYKKPFEGDKFMEFMNSNNISDPDVAFKLYSAEDEQKLIEEKHKTELAQARDEGAREARSRFHIPEDAGRGVTVSPLRLPVRTPAVTTPTPTPTPTPAPVNVQTASPSTRMTAAVETAASLRDKMQMDFSINKDKP